MIRRDTYGIVVQHSADFTYEDGGDSAMRTSLLAVCGSREDISLLVAFNCPPNSGTLVRHPFQAPWNNPNNFTRDQLTCFMSGAYAGGYYAMTKRVFIACVKRGFRAQNTEFDYPGTLKKFPNGPDLLSPSDVLHLAVCAKYNILVIGLLSLLGLPWFLASIIWATRGNPWQEQNQIICQCLTMGKWVIRLYAKLHPDYKKNLREYWGGWRDQAEIGEMLIAKVESVRA